jgi:hypothetical protein
LCVAGFAGETGLRAVVATADNSAASSIRSWVSPPKNWENNRELRVIETEAAGAECRQHMLISGSCDLRITAQGIGAPYMVDERHPDGNPMPFNREIDFHANVFAHVPQYPPKAAAPRPPSTDDGRCTALV